MSAAAKQEQPAVKVSPKIEAAPPKASAITQEQLHALVRTWDELNLWLRNSPGGIGVEVRRAQFDQLIQSLPK